MPSWSETSGEMHNPHADASNSSSGEELVELESEAETPGADLANETTEEDDEEEEEFSPTLRGSGILRRHGRRRWR